MKRILVSLIAMTFVFGLCAEARFVTKVNSKKDVLKDKEYKELKIQFFQADGYGDMYNCKVEQEKFCKVKDYDSGLFVLCDRNVSRTQWESAKVYFKLGRCVKLN